MKTPFIREICGVALTVGAAAATATDPVMRSVTLELAE